MDVTCALSVDVPRADRGGNGSGATAPCGVTGCVLAGMRRGVATNSGGAALPESRGIEPLMSADVFDWTPTESTGELREWSAAEAGDWWWETGETGWMDERIAEGSHAGADDMGEGGISFWSGGCGAGTGGITAEAWLSGVGIAV